MADKASEAEMKSAEYIRREPQVVRAYQWFPQYEHTDDLPPPGEHCHRAPAPGGGSGPWLYWVINSSAQEEYLSPGDWVLTSDHGVSFWRLPDATFKRLWMCVRGRK